MQGESVTGASQIEEKEFQQPCNFNELLQRWNIMRDSGYKRIDEAQTPEEKSKAYEDLCAETDKFVHQLIMEKERFMRVFETEKGSTYFQMKDGCTVRFKKVEKKVREDQTVYEYSIQRPSNIIFWVNTDVAKEFLEHRSSNTLFLNRKFKTDEYGVGVQPIEFILPQDDEYFNIVQDSNSFMISAKKEIPGFLEPALPNHVGNKITLIYS